MNKPILGLAILALIVASASLTEVFVLSGQLADQSQKVSSEASQLQAASNQLASYANALSEKQRSATRTIHLTIVPDIAGDGYDKFLPQTVVVNKGDKVQLIINNTDEMDHGFAIDALGINKPIKPLETVTIEFTADTAGVFEFYCTAYCGPGHSEMTGQLIVLG